MQELMTKANVYMKDTGLPVELRDKVRKYLHMQYNESNLAYDEQELLDMLPESLVGDIMMFKARDIVALVPLLKEHSFSFQSRCCAAPSSTKRLASRSSSRRRPGGRCACPALVAARAAGERHRGPSAVETPRTDCGAGPRVKAPPSSSSVAGGANP